jgi:ABC-type phosphate transport system permease subunit
MESIINTVVYGSIGLVVLFLLLTTIVLPYFNASYNTTVTGLSSSFLQGILLLVFILAMIGFAIRYIPKFK